MESPSKIRPSTRRFQHSSSSSVLFLLSLSLLLHSGTLPVSVMSLGINYGQIANNLPTPEKVVPLVNSIGSAKVKLYDTDPKVLKAFAKTGIEFTVTIGNEYLPQIAKDPKQAVDWVKKNVQPYLPDTNIERIHRRMVDAVYAAMGPNYSKKVMVHVSETGWPSKGDEDEIGATPENAKKYNGNLIKLVNSEEKKGTPMNPESDLNVFVFALFNENMKPGPTSEMNYGLFKPDGTAAYSLGIPTIQAVGNSSSSGGSSDGSESQGPAAAVTVAGGEADGGASNGYLSISFSMERYPSVGLTITTTSLLMLVMMML